MLIWVRRARLLRSWSGDAWVDPTNCDSSCYQRCTLRQKLHQSPQILCLSPPVVPVYFHFHTTRHAELLFHSHQSHKNLFSFPLYSGQLTQYGLSCNEIFVVNLAANQVTANRMKSTSLKSEQKSFSSLKTNVCCCRRTNKSQIKLRPCWNPIQFWSISMGVACNLFPPPQEPYNISFHPCAHLQLVWVNAFIQSDSGSHSNQAWVAVQISPCNVVREKMYFTGSHQSPSVPVVSQYKSTRHSQHVICCEWWTVDISCHYKNLLVDQMVAQHLLSRLPSSMQ